MHFMRTINEVFAQSGMFLRMSRAEHIRPLGGLEYAFWIMDLTARTNFVMTVEITGELSESTIRKALDALQQRHPLLNVAIEPDVKEGAVFVPVTEPIPLRSIGLLAPGREFTGAGDPLVHAMQDAQIEPFNPGEGPLMRCLLINLGRDRKILIFTFHHAIGDGVSGACVVRDMLEIAQRVARGLTDRLPLVPEPGPLDRHLPEKHTGVAGYGRMLRETIRMNLDKGASRPVHLPEAGRAWPYEREDRFVLTRLDRETGQRLAERAFIEGCSVHDALTAAQLLTIKAEHPKKRSVRAWQLSLVDLRKRVAPPVSPDALGLMISSAESCHRIGRKTDFWSLAGEVHEVLRDRIASGFPFYFLPWHVRLLKNGQIRHQPDEDGSRKILRFGQRARPMVSSISNIGRFEAPTDYGAFTLDALHFAMPLSSSGLFASSAVSFAGRLFWNFTYATPSVTPERAERMARRAVDLVKEHSQ
jgi:hypothetical protein